MGQPALIRGDPRTVRGGLCDDEVGVRGDRHDVLVRLSQVRQDDALNEEIRPPRDSAHQFALRQAEAPRDGIDVGPQRLKLDVLRFHLRAIALRRGEDGPHAARRERHCHREHGIQIAVRAERGEHDLGAARARAWSGRLHYRESYSRPSRNSLAAQSLRDMNPRSK